MHDQSQTIHERAMSKYTFNHSHTYTRSTELHDLYGGNRQGGICPCKAHDLIFLFTGEANNHNGWQEGGSYLYTGEGQRGDMEFNRGNLAVRDHQKNGKELHLFKKQPKGKSQSQGYAYIGQFRVEDYEERRGHDTEGLMRRIYVFKLRPVGAVIPSSDVKLAEEELRAVIAGQHTTKGQRYRHNAEERLALERYGMAHATAFYEAQGWCVEEAPAHEPFDLSCTKDGSERHVKVKAVINDGSSVLLTTEEVMHARAYRHVDLYVVYAIKLSYAEDGQFALEGGVGRQISPWRPATSSLKPLGYEYILEPEVR